MTALIVHSSQSKVKILKTGEIWLVNLDPTSGDEIRKTRPVVIINPGHMKSLRLSIVLPLTRFQEKWRHHPFFVFLEPNPTSGLSRASVVDCFQIRSLSHTRCITKLGHISEQELASLKTALALILDIDAEDCRN